MRPSGPTSWLLNGKLGWLSTSETPRGSISIGARSDIRLAADPRGPLGLTSADGSLGAVRLPRGIAVDPTGLLYLLDRSRAQIKRFDPEQGAFVPLPFAAAQTAGTATLATADTIAIAGPTLYIADQSQRLVLAYDRRTLQLQARWRLVEPAYRPVAATAPGPLMLLTSPEAVARALATYPNELFQYMRAGLSATTRAMLDRYDPAQPVDAALARALTSDFDTLLRGPSLYAAPPFRQARLDAATRRLISTAATAEQLIELNQRLLAAVFPRALTTRAWLPVDLTAQGNQAYILDQRYGRVYRHTAGTAGLTLVVDRPDRAGRWTAVAVDRDDRLYLLDEAAQQLELFTAAGAAIGTASDAGAVRGRFPAPAIRVDNAGRFCLPAGLTRLCDRSAGEPPPLEDPLLQCRLAARPSRTGAATPTLLVFDRAGNQLQFDPAEASALPVYRSMGTWYSSALDSARYDCQWHRIDLELSALPAGTQLVVSTFTDNQPASVADIRALPAGLWETRYTITATNVPPGPAPAVPLRHACLVQSRPGRFLWLKIDLHGDGYHTPAVHTIRIHYPRESLLEYLPAVYAADEESRWFLERFLAIFQDEWDSLAQRVAEVAAYFDPAAVPAERGGIFIKHLARLLALPLEGEWSSEQQRRLLIAAPHFTPHRGQPAALRDYLRVYLANLSGLETDELAAFPQFVEGFRERRRLLLSLDSAGRLCHGAPLWSPAQVGRLQLDGFAREGEVRLISTGDPQRDLFHEYAHRFWVFIPRALVRTAAAEQMIRRAIEAEKPAHTRYDLCLVEPRLRVGLQSTVGIDTLVGAYPTAQLDRDAAPDTELPAEPRHRLGYDTVLAAVPAAAGDRPQQPRDRVGIDTYLQ